MPAKTPTTRSNSPLITVKNLYLAYRQPVIKNLSFSLHSGDFLCLVGPNGSGKSTLVRALLGLHPVHSGKIIYSPTFSQKNIGYLPQSSHIDPLFPASVYEVVRSGAIRHRCATHPLLPNLSSPSPKDLTLATLKLLSSSNLLHAPFSTLSGGQRQRVLLARALTATHQLLILDEPTNNLDSASRRQIFDIIKRLNADFNLTIILITHHLSSAHLLGTHLLSLADPSPSLQTLTTSYSKQGDHS